MELLPSKEVQSKFKKTWAVLISRVICKYLSSFNQYRSLVIHHIPHKFTLFHDSIRQPKRRNASPSLLLSRALCVVKTERSSSGVSLNMKMMGTVINHDFLYAVLKVVQTREINITNFQIPTLHIINNDICYMSNTSRAH